MRLQCKIFLFFFYRFIYIYILQIYLFYLFIFWLHWVFVAAHRLSLVVVSGGYSSLPCVGFLLRRLLSLRSTGSRHAVAVVVAHRLSSCGSRALECRFSSCGTRAQLLHGMWDLPGPGLKPMSPALVGGLLTTVALGKPSFFF